MLYMNVMKKESKDNEKQIYEWINRNKRYEKASCFIRKVSSNDKAKIKKERELVEIEAIAKISKV